MAQARNPGLDGLSSAVQAFTQDVQAGGVRDEVLDYLAASAAVHRLLAAIRAAELSGASAEGIRAAVAPARELQAASPLVRRMLTWPRGYQGDFETIEGLCGSVAETSHPLDRCAVTLPAAQQHRNKVAWQAQQLLAAALARRGARLLSVACGGSRDVAEIAPLLRGRGVELTLNDADPDALALSRARAEPAGASVTVVPGDVFRAVRRLARAAPFDVVVAGGLFDYLDARRATWLLARLRALVAPGGALCFTNLTPGGAYQGWLTHLAGWSLIYRDEAEVRRLLAEAGAGAEDVTTTARDATGQALLVRHVVARGAASTATPTATPTSTSRPRLILGDEARTMSRAERWRLLSPHLRQHGGEALSYATLQQGLEHFVDEAGYLSFVTVQHPLLAPRPRRVVLCDPLCAPADLPGLLGRFLADEPRAAFAVISERCAGALRDLGFRANCIGSEPELDVQRYDTRGNWKALDLVKRARNEARREGIAIREVDVAALDPAELAAVSSGWLAGKRVSDREIWIFARRPVLEAEPDVRKLAAFDRDGRLCGYVFYDPMYRDGRVVGYAATTPRTDERRFGRLTTAIHMEAIDLFRAEGKEVLNLCLSPFVELDAGRFNDDRALRAFFALTARHGGAIYNFDGLAFHKAKYRGTPKPIYFASRSRLAVNEVYLGFHAAGISRGWWSTMSQLATGMARSALRRR